MEGIHEEEVHAFEVGAATAVDGCSSIMPAIRKQFFGINSGIHLIPWIQPIVFLNPPSGLAFHMR